MWITVVTLGLKFLRGYWFYLVIFLLGVWCAVKVNGCIYGHGGPSRTPYTVNVVVSGSCFEIEDGGLFRRRTKKLHLWGIDIPPNFEQQAKDNLEKYVSPNDTIYMEIEAGRRIGGGDESGIVLTGPGLNLNLAQLRAGVAKNTTSRKDFLAAEKEAQRNGLGVWFKSKPVDPKRPHIFREEGS